MIRAAVSVALVAVLPVAGAAQTPIFSSRVEAIRVDVLVSDGGRPVLGLEASDFEVRDNGVLQQVDVVSFEEVPLNVVLAFDVSGSVKGQALAHLQAAGATLLEALTPNDRTALVTFTQVVALGSGLTHDRAQVRDALARVEAEGGTALVDGTYAAMLAGEADVGRPLLMVFSDGLDTASWLTAEAVLDTARRSDVVVYGVSTGGDAADFLRDLTELTGGRILKVDSPQRLGAAFVGILDEFRHRYLLSYRPRGVDPIGWHRLDVRVKGRNADVKARPGYLAGGTSSLP